MHLMATTIKDVPALNPHKDKLQTENLHLKAGCFI